MRVFDIFRCRFRRLKFRPIQPITMLVFLHGYLAIYAKLSSIIILRRNHVKKKEKELKKQLQDSFFSNCVQNPLFSEHVKEKYLKLFFWHLIILLFIWSIHWIFTFLSFVFLFLFFSSFQCRLSTKYSKTKNSKVSKTVGHTRRDATALVCEDFTHTYVNPIPIYLFDWTNVFFTKLKINTQ